MHVKYIASEKSTVKLDLMKIQLILTFSITFHFSVPDQIDML